MFVAFGSFLYVHLVITLLYSTLCEGCVLDVVKTFCQSPGSINLVYERVYSEVGGNDYGIVSSSDKRQHWAG